MDRPGSRRRGSAPRTYARPIRPRVVSFDCLGTLIDWERGLREGITAAIGPLQCDRLEALLRERAAIEWATIAELTEFLPYREILENSLEQAAARVEFPLRRSAAETIAAGIRSWPPFPDAKAGLARIAARHPVAVLSNCNRSDLRHTLRALGIETAHIVAADDVSSYKPEPDHLMALVHELGIDEHELLHVSAYPEFDLRTAQDLGIPGAFFDRGAARLPEDIAVEVTISDLADLSRHLAARA